MFALVLIVNWYGDRVWERALAEQAAKGFPLDELPPAGTLPPEKNLMCAPIVERLWYRERNGESFSGLTGRVGFTDQRLWNWNEGKRLKVDALYSQLQTQGFTPSGTLSPEQGVLEAFEADFGLLAEVRREALDRGDAQLSRPGGIRKEGYFLSQNPAFETDRLVCQLFRLEACIALRQGREREAYEDVLTMLRLVRGHGGSRQVFVVESMVQTIYFQHIVAVVWEASRTKAWTAEQWAAIDSELERIKISDTVADSLWMDYLCTSQVLDMICCGPQEPTAGSSHWVRRAAGGFVTRGVRELNKVAHAENICWWMAALQACGSSRQLELRREAQTAQAAMLNKSAFNLTTILVRSMVIANDRLVDIAVVQQSYLVLARIACALERERIEQGRYPTQLELLGPGVLARLPRDPVNGELPHYRLREDGQYELYTVGLDGRDDGGLRAEESRRFEEWKGDIVWPVLAPGEASR